MRKYVTLFAALLVAAPVAQAAEDDRAPPTKAPSAMTPTEIKAYNEGLAQTHPYYIKCRKTLEIGSLVKKNRVCYTNEKWKEVSAKGNQDARDTAEAMTSKAAGGSN
ncbi:hypothetical protein EEB18_011415 [Sphingopyxis sp. OPL5]|uniref:hypothetical protein n=1 Tax=unclassified Sphingopyxis TaxID=2614943 RepID=UPI0007002A5C|nr:MULTISPECIES: hypothetical protein [unclassified Sphingopyxis]KQZ65843.1 hypothetical protein ASD67_01755 [Sphingopyxis sp. Root1497]QNO25419.1 hypothetical protein EEB18_011415 [Sphingopyxis sp. OPL5]